MTSKPTHAQKKKKKRRDTALKQIHRRRHTHNCTQVCAHFSSRGGKPFHQPTSISQTISATAPPQTPCKESDKALSPRIGAPYKTRSTRDHPTRQQDDQPLAAWTRQTCTPFFFFVLRKRSAVCLGKPRDGTTTTRRTRFSWILFLWSCRP